MDAVKCPVCEGKQTLQEGFYGDKDISLALETCRSCSGLGYIALFEAVPQPRYVPVPYPYPTYPGYPWWSKYTWGGNAATPLPSGTTTVTTGTIGNGVSWFKAYPPGSSMSFTSGCVQVRD